MALKKHSVKISGHQTSITLEDEFWAELCTIAETRKRSLNDLVAEIDATRTGNLSSAIRLFVLETLKSSAQA